MKKVCVNKLQETTKNRETIPKQTVGIIYEIYFFDISIARNDEMWMKECALCAVDVIKLFL